MVASGEGLIDGKAAGFCWWQSEAKVGMLIMESPQDILDGRFLAYHHHDAVGFLACGGGTEEEYLDFHRGSVWFGRW